MKKVNLFLIALGLGAMTISVAQQPTKNLKEQQLDLFHKLDENKDDKLSLGEFKNMSEVVKLRREELRKSNFELLDANGDGKVTLEEFEAITHEPKHKLRRGTMDKKEIFEMRDTNKDGAITLEEFQKTPRTRMGDSERRMSNPERKFERLDTDNDGFLTIKEFTDRKMQPKRGHRNFKKGNRRMRN